MNETYAVPSAIQATSLRQSKSRSANVSVPIVSPDHKFEIPAKLIKTVSDMSIWEKSEAYFEYLGFILAINEAVKGKSNSRGSASPSEEVLKVIGFLDKLDALVEETPPIQQPQRFGNVAFRSWYKKMRDGSLVLLQEILTTELNRSIPEIVNYLKESFGNSTRIDYGTGHEMSFVMFLCCLFKIGLLKEADKVNVGCSIFVRYLNLARKLQKVYRMEPAGSHGVWSLDDYQFIPFIWGSSQLFAHPKIEPAGFLLPNVLDECGDDYMFLQCIQYINSVKTGPFAEHSNQLWGISGVSSWSKINAGLIKMYKAEVLSKFPVVQHIVFGSLFTLKPVQHTAGLMSARLSVAPSVIPFKGSNASSLGSSRGDKQSEGSVVREDEEVLKQDELSKESVGSKGSNGEPAESTAQPSKSSKENLTEDDVTSQNDTLKKTDGAEVATQNDTLKETDGAEVTSQNDALEKTDGAE